MHLLKGIQRAISDSVLVLIGFLIYNFIISIFSCYLFKHIAPEYFSDPIRSLYSIFRIFTVEGWYEIPDTIAASSSVTTAAFSKLFFVLVLLTGGIFGLSLVNSIFVDAMVRDNTDELEKKVDVLNKKIDTLLKVRTSE
jgi:voltage-gated sodium channel